MRDACVCAKIYVCEFFFDRTCAREVTSIKSYCYDMYMVGIPTALFFIDRKLAERHGERREREGAPVSAVEQRDLEIESAREKKKTKEELMMMMMMIKKKKEKKKIKQTIRLYIIMIP